MLAARSRWLNISDHSTERVPISTGRPCARSRCTSATTAANLASSVGKIRSGHCCRRTGRFVGTQTTRWR
jgi:hypothetical protein